MRIVIRSPISRRSLLLSSAAGAAGAAGLAACAPQKATGFFGYCFVANQESRSVGVVDLTRFRVRRQIPLDAAPGVVLAHPTKPKAFVLAPEAGTVYEIDASFLTLGRRARAGNQAVGMRLSRHGDALWVLYRDPASLVELPLDSFQPGRPIRLAAPPDDFDLSPETDDAAVVMRSNRTVAIVSLANASITRTIQAATEPSIVRFRFDGRQLIAGSQADRSLTIYDAASGRAVVRLPLPLGPRNFCFTPLGGQLYVTGDGMDAVVTVYPYRTEVVETILAGRAPGAMAVTSETSPSYLLIANPETAGVTVLDVETGKLVAVVQVGQRPCNIILTPDKQYALVLNEKSGDLAVIRIFSLSGRQPGGDRVRRYKSAPLFTLIPVGEKPVSAAVVALT
jgi:DNA-binding beta-propeller fold protein YncE